MSITGITAGADSQITAEVAGYYNKLLLTRAEANLVHDKMGQMRPVPKNNSLKATFRRYENLAVNTSALTEGVTPSGTSLTETDVTATASQYGDFVTMSDLMTDNGLDLNVVAEATDILGYQMGLSVDTVWRDAIIPSLANNVIVGQATEGAVTATDTITVASIKQAILNLKNQNAMKFTSKIGATDKVGTKPIRAGYFGIIHPDVVYDLEDQDGYIASAEYAQYGDLQEGEVGSVKEARFVETTNAYINANGGDTNVDTYHTAIFGKEAYGIVDVRGKDNSSIIVKPAGSAGTADPLNQRSTVGWKCVTTAVILNDAFAVSIISASSQGANT